MKRKLLAMLLCAALTFAIFGTLAVGAEENVTELTQDPAPVCNCAAKEDTPHAENCPCYVAPTCTCGTEDDIHTEDCALYTAPEAEPKEEPQEEPKEEPQEELKEEPKAEPKEEAKEEPKEEPQEEPQEEAKEEPKDETPVCDCGTENDTHAEDCPCYVAPELTLYERLMATTTKEEFDSIIAQASQEELVFPCQEFDDLDAHYIYLTTGEYPNYEPVVDVVLSIVDFTNAAPLVGSGK